MNSGRSLWDELAFKYQEGVDEVRTMKAQWASVRDDIDPERHRAVEMLLKIQEEEAVWWKNASLLYFQTFSGLPIPEGVQKPDKTLDYYQSLQFPYAPGIRPRW